MSTREYIGARYVPLFAEPIEWDSSKTYEPLTVVYHQGNSYTSRQAVPAGINIDNETYWALTGNYNAQIEQYRSEVEAFDRRITQNAEGIEQNSNDISYMNNYFASLLPDSSFTSTNTVKKAIDANTTAIEDSKFKLKGKTIVIYGDSTMVDTSGGSTALGTLIAQKTGATVINRAIAGTNLTSLVSLLNNASANDFNNVDYCFFAYGTNDWGGSRPISIINGDNSFEALLNQAIIRYKAIAPNTIPVFVTPACGKGTWATAGIYFTNYNNRGNVLKDYVNAILYFCFKNDIACVDLHGIFGIDDKDADKYTIVSHTSDEPDRNWWLHYNQALKVKIAEYLNAVNFYQTPGNPYNGTKALTLFEDTRHHSLEVVNVENKVLENSTLNNYPGMPAIKLTNNDNNAKFICNLTGNDTLIIGAKTTEIKPFTVYVNDTPICGIVPPVITAVNVKGFVNDNAVVQFKTNQSVTYISNFLVYNGVAPVVNERSMFWRSLNPNWRFFTGFNDNGSYLGMGNNIYHLHLDITFTSTIEANTNLLALPMSLTGTPLQMVTGYTWSTDNYTVIPVQIIRNDKGYPVLTPKVRMPSGSRFVLDFTNTPTFSIGIDDYWA